MGNKVYVGYGVDRVEKTDFEESRESFGSKSSEVIGVSVKQYDDLREELLVLKGHLDWYVDRVRELEEMVVD